MHVPESLVLDLGKHEFIRRPCLIGQAKDLRPALDQPDFGVAHDVCRQVDAYLVGALDIVVGSVGQLLQSFGAAIPAAAQAEFRNEDSDPAADVDALQKRLGLSLSARIRHLVYIDDNVIERMVGGDFPKAAFGKRLEKNLLGRLIEIWRSGDRIADNHPAVHHVVAQGADVRIAQPQRAHAAEQQCRQLLRVEMKVVEVGVLPVISQVHRPGVFNQLLRVRGTQVPIGDFHLLSGGIDERGGLSPDDFSNETIGLRRFFALGPSQRRSRQRQRRKCLGRAYTLTRRFPGLFGAQIHKPVVLIRSAVGGKTEERHGRAQH